MTSVCFRLGSGPLRLVHHVLREPNDPFVLNAASVFSTPFPSLSLAGIKKRSVDSDGFLVLVTVAPRGVELLSRIERREHTVWIGSMDPRMERPHAGVGAVFFPFLGPVIMCE